jgi:hypothetical protein
MHDVCGQCTNLDSQLGTTLLGTGLGGAKWPAFFSIRSVCKLCHEFGWCAVLDLYSECSCIHAAFLSVHGVCQHTRLLITSRN